MPNPDLSEISKQYLVFWQCDQCFKRKIKASSPLIVFLFHLHLHYPMLLNASFISVPVLEENGLVSLSRALGLAVLEEVPTFQPLMRNTIPSSETVVMS